MADNKIIICQRVSRCHHLKILLVCCNDIKKKTCLIPDAQSKPLHFSHLLHVMCGTIRRKKLLSKLYKVKNVEEVNM